MTSGRVILAPGGFPWLAFAAWIVVTAIGVTIGLNLFASTPIGGSFTVSAILANAAFAAMLGRT